MKLNCSPESDAGEALCPKAGNDTKRISTNSSILNTAIVYCIRDLFLRSQKSHASTMVFLLSCVDIQVGDRNFRGHLLVKDPKRLPDDRVILNFNTASVT